MHHLSSTMAAPPSASSTTTCTPAASSTARTAWAWAPGSVQQSNGVCPRLWFTAHAYAYMGAATYEHCRLTAPAGPCSLLTVWGQDLGRAWGPPRPASHDSRVKPAALTGEGSTLDRPRSHSGGLTGLGSSLSTLIGQGGRLDRSRGLAG